MENRFDKMLDINQIPEAYGKYAAGDYQGAVLACEQMLAQKPGQLQPLLLMSKCHMLLGHPELAQARFEEIMKSVSGSLDANSWYIYSDLAFSMELPPAYCAGLFLSAATAMKKGGSKKVLLAEVYNRAGMCKYRGGAPLDEEQSCFEQALKYIGRSARNAPTKGVIQCNLAECFMRTDNLDRAEKLYLGALEVFERMLSEGNETALDYYSVCQKGLSEIYRSRGDNILSLKRLNLVIEKLSTREGSLHPGLRQMLAICYNSRGTLKFQMGDYQGEVNDCTESIRLREGFEQGTQALGVLYTNRAEAHQLLKQLDQSRRDFEHAAVTLEGIALTAEDYYEAGMKYYSAGLICEEQEDNEGICRNMRKAADCFFKSNDLPKNQNGMFTNYENVEQVMNMESLSRFMLSIALRRSEKQDQYEALKQAKLSISLAEELNPNLELVLRLRTLYESVGQMLETLEEEDDASKAFTRSAQYAEMAKSALQNGLELDELRDDMEDFENIDKYLEYLIDHMGDERAEDDSQLEEDGDIWEDTAHRTPQG